MWKKYENKIISNNKSSIYIKVILKRYVNLSWTVGFKKHTIIYTKSNISNQREFYKFMKIL